MSLLISVSSKLWLFPFSYCCARFYSMERTQYCFVNDFKTTFEHMFLSSLLSIQTGFTAETSCNPHRWKKATRVEITDFMNCGIWSQFGTELSLSL